MVSFKRGGDNNSSFNIGLGAVVDTGVQVLGDGFEANQAAPLDENGDPLDVRFRKTDQWGWFFLLAFTLD